MGVSLPKMLAPADRVLAAVAGLACVVVLASASSAPAWQMYGHDSSHSAQSRYLGPVTSAAGLWMFPTQGQVMSSPAVDADGGVYVGSDDGNVYAINATGAQRWVFSTGGAVTSSPALSADGGVVFVGSNDYFVYAIDAASGSKVSWNGRGFGPLPWDG